MVYPASHHALPMEWFVVSLRVQENSMFTAWHHESNFSLQGIASSAMNWSRGKSEDNYEPSCRDSEENLKLTVGTITRV
jgi:hypothetical protein